MTICKAIRKLLRLKDLKCVFRVIPATDSDRIRPPIPNESGHPFRGKWPPIPTKTATPHPEGAGSVLDAV